MPAADAAAPVEGKVRVFKGADPALDRYIRLRGCKRYLARYVRMRLFSDFSDRCVDGGYRGGLANMNAQAIQVESVRIRRGDGRRVRARKRALDRMVLRDGRGRRLYVPFDCSRGRCPQYAADVADPAWRRHLAREARGLLRHRYAGVFLDDVNWQVNVSDGRERPVPAMDPARWKRAMARLVRTVRRAAGRREVMVNTVWWRPESSLDDPVVRDGMAAATDAYIERGTEDTRRGQSYPGLLTTIDRLHALGLGVTLENYVARARPEAEFELASYLLHAEGRRDAVGTEYASCPRRRRDNPRCRVAYWKGYRANLGRAAGPRLVRPDGLIERRFEHGMVLLNPPGGAPRTGALGGLYRDLDGTPRVFAGLTGGRALVLTR